MSKTNPSFLPEVNLEALKAEEEDIRGKSSLHINTQINLIEHIKLVHSGLDIIMWTHQRTKNLNSDRSVAVAGIRVRLFNSISCTLKLLLSGYYQGAISFIRDILEISFLLDFFSYDSDAIERWIKNPDTKEFKPFSIRKNLDLRDGFTSERRKQTYKLFCTYGTHATFDGNKLLSNNNLITIGPFFNPKFLENILFELANLVPQPVMFCFGDNADADDYRKKKDFFATTQSWWKLNKQGDLCDKEMEELEKALALFESIQYKWY